MNHLRVHVAIASILIAAPAAAYIGPGAGIGAIGTVVAFLGAILLMIVGFVWYPVKRLLRKRKRQETEPLTQDQSLEEPEPETKS